MRRTDRDREFCVARVINRKRESLACISGGNDHSHTRPGKSVDFDADRTLATGKPFRIEVVSQTHVHSVHDELAAITVQLLDHLNRSDDGARVSFAVLIEHFKTQEHTLRSDT